MLSALVPVTVNYTLDEGEIELSESPFSYGNG